MVRLWTTAGASLLLIAVGAAFHLLSGLADLPGHPYWGGNSLAAASYALLGALILTYHPGHRIGWLFLLSSVVTAVGMVAGEIRAVRAAGSAPTGCWRVLSPGSAIGAGGWGWPPLPSACSSSPDGHFSLAPLAIVAGALGLGLALAMVGDALMPGPMRLMPGTNPLGMPGAAGVLDAARYSGGALQVASGVAAVLGLLRRLRQARGVERQQLKWFAYASALCILLLVGGLLLDGLIGSRLLGPLGSTLGISLLLPTALTVAVLRYQLFAIDRLINRTLVYGALTLMVAILYVTLVGSASALVQGRGTTVVSLLVTGGGRRGVPATARLASTGRQPTAVRPT